MTKYTLCLFFVSLIALVSASKFLQADTYSDSQCGSAVSKRDITVAGVCNGDATMECNEDSITYYTWSNAGCSGKIIDTTTSQLGCEGESEEGGSVFQSCVNESNPLSNSLLLTTYEYTSEEGECSGNITTVNDFAVGCYSRYYHGAEAWWNTKCSDVGIIYECTARGCNSCRVFEQYNTNVCYGNLIATCN